MQKNLIRNVFLAATGLISGATIIGNLIREDGLDCANGRLDRTALGLINNFSNIENINVDVDNTLLISGKRITYVDELSLGMGFLTETPHYYEIVDTLNFILNNIQGFMMKGATGKENLQFSVVWNSIYPLCQTPKIGVHRYGYGFQFVSEDKVLKAKLKIQDDPDHQLPSIYVSVTAVEGQAEWIFLDQIRDIANNDLEIVEDIQNLKNYARELLKEDQPREQ